MSCGWAVISYDKTVHMYNTGLYWRQNNSGMLKNLEHVPFFGSRHISFIDLNQTSLFIGTFQLWMWIQMWTAGLSTKGTDYPASSSFLPPYIYIFIKSIYIYVCLYVHSDLTDTVFLWVLKGAELPADGAERAPLEAGPSFGDAVDLLEDGAPQQDVDPRVQDLVAGRHPDPDHHQTPIRIAVVAQEAAVGLCGWHQSKDLQRNDWNNYRMKDHLLNWIFNINTVTATVLTLLLPSN